MSPSPQYKLFLPSIAICALSVGMALISLTTVSNELAGAGLCGEVSYRTNYQLRMPVPAFRYQHMKSQNVSIELDRIDENASVLYVDKDSYIIERAEQANKWHAWGGSRHDDFHVTKETRMMAAVACVWHAVRTPVAPKSPAKSQRYVVELRAA